LVAIGSREPAPQIAHHLGSARCNRGDINRYRGSPDREGMSQLLPRPDAHIHDGNVLLYKEYQDTLHVYDYVSE